MIREARLFGKRIEKIVGTEEGLLELGETGAETVVFGGHSTSGAGWPAVFIIEPGLHAQRLCLLHAGVNAPKPFLGQIWRRQSHAGMHEEPSEAHLLEDADLPTQLIRLQFGVPCPERGGTVAGVRVQHLVW